MNRFQQFLKERCSYEVETTLEKFCKCCHCQKVIEEYEKEESDLVVIIGNSDNKLTQQEWSEFVYKLKELVDRYSIQTYFFGAPGNYDPWQNVAWSFKIRISRIDAFKSALVFLREKYKQESVAFMESKFNLI